MSRFATSSVKTDTRPPIELVVDNGGDRGDRKQGGPLPWAACLLAWALLAAAGWSAIAFLFHWI